MLNFLAKVAKSRQSWSHWLPFPRDIFLQLFEQKITSRFATNFMKPKRLVRPTQEDFLPQRRRLYLNSPNHKGKKCPNVRT